MQGQEAVAITLKSGKKIEGIARNRNNYSLQVVDRAGNLHLIPMLDVTELEISTRSPMPDDYGKRLTKQELENLMAFLARQSIRPFDEYKGESLRCLHRGVFVLLHGVHHCFDTFRGASRSSVCRYPEKPWRELADLHRKLQRLEVRSGPPDHFSRMWVRWYPSGSIM